MTVIDEPVDLTDVSLHVIGAILKVWYYWLMCCGRVFIYNVVFQDLLRNVPGGVIPSARYTEFVATNDIHEYDLRIQKIRMYAFD